MDEFTSEQSRQAIDAESTFMNWRKARAELKSVRGSMFWREQAGKVYLIRANANKEQRSLGPKNDETTRIHERFVARKSELEQREKSLRDEVEKHRRLNRAHQIGRVPTTVIEVLNALEQCGVAQDFTVIGTHALFAYAAAARVHLSTGDTATQDVDLMFDVRRHLSFVRTLHDQDLSLLDVIKKADPSFERKSDQQQLYTAVNDKGFEVDVVRRMALDGDPHPLRMTADEGDIFAAQISAGSILENEQRMEQIVMATNGKMAVMRTIAPAGFCKAKGLIAALPSRDPGKARRDRAQIAIVQHLVHEYLPQWNKGMPGQSTR